MPGKEEAEIRTHTTARPTVSVVIPVLNAEPYLAPLLDAIFSQTPTPPHEVILVDSMSTDHTLQIATRYENVKVIPIKNFSHGRGRNVGIQAATGDLVALLTQDALPATTSWLAQLIEPFSDPQVAATYARQTPRDDANPMECYFLQTHFPETPRIQYVQDHSKELTFQEDVFFSNVSGAIRRSIILKTPFEEHLIMSEDQQFARDVLLQGFRIVYTPKSVVIHSHNYSLRSVFKRYFDSIYSLTQLFNHTLENSTSMGLNYLLKEIRHMVRHHPFWLPYYGCYTAAKTAGAIAGHYADHMPLWLLKRISLHSYHWKQQTS